jgi:hypothetical protein
LSDKEEKTTLLQTLWQKRLKRFFENAEVRRGKGIWIAVVLSCDAAFGMPTWRDASNNPVTATQFVFSGFAKPTALQNIDSQSLQLSLTGAITYPASVAITRPSRCSIGSKKINDAFVYLILNATVYRSNSTVQILDGNLQTWALRFASEGNYGSLTGAVTCLGAGRLRYSY